jgi:hypothetical protein
MTCYAIPAWRKTDCRQGQGCRKRRRAKPEGNTGIRNQGSRQQLHLKKERTTGNGIRGWSRRQEPCLGSRTTLDNTFRKIVEWEITKQIVRTSIRLQKMSVRTLWRGQPPKQKKVTAHRLRVMGIGELTTFGTVSCTDQRKMMVINWSGLYLIRELLGTSNLKEAAVGE